MATLEVRITPDGDVEVVDVTPDYRKPKRDDGFCHDTGCLHYVPGLKTGPTTPRSRPPPARCGRTRSTPTLARTP